MFCLEGLTADSHGGATNLLALEPYSSPCPLMSLSGYHPHRSLKSLDNT